MTTTLEASPTIAVSPADLTETDLRFLAPPIDGDPQYKNLLSMRQLTVDAVSMYLGDAHAAEQALRGPDNGVNLLPRYVAIALMRQRSTRTAHSFATAMTSLGGSGRIEDMTASAEGKGETPFDSAVALGVQARIIGTRTHEAHGPAFVAYALDTVFQREQLMWRVPVINLGDGMNEHPTQALGDLDTIAREFGQFDNLTLAMVGDFERYRAHRSLMIGAGIVGVKRVIAVESQAAPVPDDLVELLGDRLVRTPDLDEAMRECDVLYMGRNPGEYTGDNPAEQARSAQLAYDYARWVVDNDRINRLMQPHAIVMHPRPRGPELPMNVDDNPRMRDVEQMAHMIPMRMAIIARHLGRSITESRYGPIG